MVRKMIFVLLAASLSLASAQEAEETVTLDLDTAVEYALSNNRTLKSNDIDLAIKERASKYSWNVFLPNVTVSGTMSRATEKNPSSYASTNAFAGIFGASSDPVLQAAAANMVSSPDYDKEEDRWSAIGTVSASLNLSLAYISQIRSAKKNYEIGKITWEQSQKETVLRIKKYFYDLLRQQEELKIKKTTLENARQRMVQAQTNYRNGAIPELSLLQTQVNYQNTKPGVDSAEQTFMQSLDMFAFLLGMPVGTKIVLDGSIDPKYIEVDVDELIAQYGQNDLNLRQIQGNIDALKLNLQAINLSTWTPALALSYSWQPVYIGDEGAFHFYKDLGDDDKWYDSGSLSLTLAWNITNMLPWSSNRQQAKDLKANIEKLELQREAVLENQKLSVRAAVDTLKLAKEQIDAMGRNVTLAQRAYDSTYRQYRNGMTELLDLRDAQESLDNAKYGLLAQKLAYIIALMDLENTLNTTLVE